jgi:hypothetical protein
MTPSFKMYSISATDGEGKCRVSSFFCRAYPETMLAWVFASRYWPGDCAFACEIIVSVLLLIVESGRNAMRFEPTVVYGPEYS